MRGSGARTHCVLGNYVALSGLCCVSGLAGTARDYWRNPGYNFTRPAVLSVLSFIFGVIFFRVTGCSTLGLGRILSSTRCSGNFSEYLALLLRPAAQFLFTASLCHSLPLLTSIASPCVSLPLLPLFASLCLRHAAPFSDSESLTILHARSLAHCSSPR